ncbi:helix-turn-helix domain-containing protein [Muricomes sp. OA1]|uniref:helix-turn-helix domain-containing protein n=1 Tax=Muricomes sp. OA1 TaxID=2914165 RepID=UPI0004713DAE|nr:helix-turn-helix transcriptional regulator [Muricomes sp. OA1]MCH1971657.1 helix-turn-helix domain-containing protein [Muricomes sp. OA1]
MKIDKQKYMIARARACMGQKELEAAGIPKGTLCRAMRDDLRPETVGKIAKALGVDVTEIIETEN